MCLGDVAPIFPKLAKEKMFLVGTVRNSPPENEVAGVCILSWLGTDKLDLRGY